MPLHHGARSGFVALVSVLVISAVCLAIATGILTIGSSYTKNSITLLSSNLAKGNANACFEEALELIRLNSSFTGTGNLTMLNGTCTYTVTNPGGNARNITSQGIVGSFTRNITGSISAINPQLVISSWIE